MTQRTGKKTKKYSISVKLEGKEYNFNYNNFLITELYLNLEKELVKKTEYPTLTFIGKPGIGKSIIIDKLTQALNNPIKL